MALNTEVPQWLVQQNMWEQQDASASVKSLVSDYFEGRRLGMQKQQQQIAMQSNLLGIEQQKQSLELGQAKIQHQTIDSTVIPTWLKDHPTWESRQDAEWPTALTPEGQSQLAQVRLRDAQSVQQKVAVAGVSEFSKRVDALSKSDPMAGSQFAPYIGKVPPPEVLQALGVAEQTLGVRQQNQKEQAALDAQARGDVATTTITDKGVSTTYKPALVDKTLNSEPKFTTIEGGVQLAWVPGGKTLHVIQPSGKKQVLTPVQMKNIASGLEDKDPRKKQIMDFLANQAVGQFSKPALDTTNAPKIRKYNPDTGLIE